MDNSCKSALERLDTSARTLPRFWSTVTKLNPGTCGQAQGPSQTVSNQYLSHFSRIRQGGLRAKRSVQVLLLMSSAALGMSLSVSWSWFLPQQTGQDHLWFHPKNSSAQLPGSWPFTRKFYFKVHGRPEHKPLWLQALFYFKHHYIWGKIDPSVFSSWHLSNSPQIIQIKQQTETS